MAQTDGEKELVLGNKQLISLFFVAAALCGVFFALGYMIGRNATKQPAVVAETGPASTSSPVPRTQDSDPPRETAPPLLDRPAPSDAVVGAESQAPAPQTQPARDTPVREAPPPVRAPAREVSKPEVAKPEVSKTEEGATYLQVTALRRTDAENLVKTLREQHFPTLLADSSKPDLFRVLVGPYRQTAEVAEAKARLKTLGFANAFVQK
jgi:cell division septation protein DedD